MISLIVAIATNNVIGKENKLPWHLPADLAQFREKTMGHKIIMGRKNYESIPEKFRPLPGRTNIVLTKQQDYNAPGCIVVNSIDDAMAITKDEKEEIFVIGGAEIWNQFLTKKMVNKMYITWIHHSFEGDIFFPHVDFKNDWNLVHQTARQKGENNLYWHSFFTYERMVV